MKILRFTDGTFISLIDTTNTYENTGFEYIDVYLGVPRLARIMSTQCLPTVFQSDIEITKTDLKGNVFKFGRDSDGYGYVEVNNGGRKYYSKEGGLTANELTLSYTSSGIEWSASDYPSLPAFSYYRQWREAQVVTYNSQGQFEILRTTYDWGGLGGWCSRDPVNNILLGINYTNVTGTDLFFDGVVVCRNEKYTRQINSTINTFTRPTVGRLLIESGNVQLEDFNLEDQITDPYTPGGESTSSTNGIPSGGNGGTGDFDNTSDVVPIPSLPSISGLETGFFTAFTPTASQMQQVSSYLWSNLINDIEQGQGISGKIDALKKVVANPYDAIMGCWLVPVSPSMGGSKEIKMYGVIQTGVVLPYASSRWVSVDCGTLNINEYWGAYLDYSPYTKTTSLYLPYIGTVSVDIDLIMAKSLQVVYHVDILSGICIAYIVVNGSVKFHYQGHCATQVPVTSADSAGMIQSGLSLVGNVANVASGAATGFATGGGIGAAMGAASSIMANAPSAVNNVMNMKPDIKSGGGIGSAGGMLSVQTPYLIIERPAQSLPTNQNSYTGYPSNITAKVGDLKGYTEYDIINLDNIPLTASEKQELENLLHEGVYL